MGLRRQSPDEGRFQGWVIVRFVIAHDGTVPALDIVHTFDERTGECVVNYMSRWTFPPPDVPGDIYVTYPFQMTDDR